MSAIDVLTRARTMLAEADTVEAAQDVAKMAKVAEELARQADLGVGAQNEAVLVRAHAYAKAADMVDADPEYQHGGKQDRKRATLPRDSVMRWRDGKLRGAIEVTAKTRTRIERKGYHLVKVSGGTT